MLLLEVYFGKDSMANVLSFKCVADIVGAHIVMDTSSGASIYVYLVNGDGYKFKQFKNGLYYFDVSVDRNKTKPSVTDYSVLQTVKNSKQCFTNNEIKEVDLSRKYQEHLFYPGTKLLSNYVAKNLITNSEITVDAVHRGELIYSPLVLYVQGHMIRTKPPIHEKIEKIPLQMMIEQHHFKTSLSIDFCV